MALSPWPGEWGLDAGALLLAVALPPARTFRLDGVAALAVPTALAVTAVRGLLWG